MTTETREHPEYLALGITARTWACISVMSKRDARDYLWRLASIGVPAVISRDADGKRWHIAIAGGLAASPAAWLASIRPPDDREIVACPKDAHGQHVRGGAGACYEERCEEPNGHTGWHVFPELGECEGCGAREGQPCNPDGCTCDGCSVVVAHVEYDGTTMKVDLKD